MSSGVVEGKTPMNNLIRRTIRTLRKNSTPVESIFWECVRSRKIHGCKFLRQHPIRFEIDGKRRFFVADFYRAEKKLVIELDGKIHDFQIEYDKNRDLILKNLGLKVVRFRNEELDDIEKVLKEIRNHF